MASPESLELARVWMQKAQHDLEVARLLIVDQKRLLDIAVYHCQQCAEKAFKAWLTAREIVFPKIHSLVKLVGMCQASDARFAQLQEHAAMLNPFVDEFRYPRRVRELDLNEAQRALHLAEEVYAFCKKQLAG